MSRDQTKPARFCLPRRIYAFCLYLLRDGFLNPNVWIRKVGTMSANVLGPAANGSAFWFIYHPWKAISKNEGPKKI